MTGIAGAAGLSALGSGYAYVAAPAAAAANAAAKGYPTAPLPPAGADIVEVDLTAKIRRQQFLAAPAGESDLATYDDAPGIKVIRLQHGQWLRARLHNALDEHTTIHWHGIRLPNAMDGVPYLTQAPVLPGESFTYAFQPPDTGTFFFHPHCDTAAQLGRGLAGVLIIDGDETRKSDADIICTYRDWRLKPDGTFDTFMTDKGAATAGTFGQYPTVNAAALPYRADLPSNGDIRLRVLNVDPTRIMEIGIEGAEAWIIATDGNAIDPVKLDTWKLGPAMRLDLQLRAPNAAGGKVQLINYFAAKPVLLAEFTSAGTPLDRAAFTPAALQPPRLAENDLANAVPQQLRLSSAGSGSQSGKTAAKTKKPADIVLPNGEVLHLADSLCLTPVTLWALNGEAWPDRSHQNLPPPLFDLAKGKTYVIEVINTTSRQHPIHLHGHTFKVLESNSQQIVPHLADTVLVAPNERVKIAFTADNPGNWMVHCHIIEHQETGMMGYFRVA
ncbi:MAG TPA: multicopper oxidase family protein [Terriglobales bacterium]|nr:multicopper oxidase family protein [Terriglobales bacterium]